MEKQAYIVLGMHRSGTSLVSAILSLFDVGIVGNIENTKKHLANPTIGEFENVEIVRINESLLKMFGASWLSPFSMPSKWWELDSCKDIKKTFKESIERQFKGLDKIAYKDPRNSICYPLHVFCLREMGYEVKGVFVKREINAIINSLKLRNKMSENVSKRIAEFYINYINNNHGNIPLIEIKYENLLENTQEELKKIIDLIGNDLDFEETLKRVHDYIDPKLNHYKG